MEWFIKAFIRASLAWFTLGLLLGIAISAYPPWAAYRPAHAHMTVVGFLTMMVFGVGYQLLPRLFGSPLHSRGAAIAHFWLANLGLAAMVVGFLMQPRVGPRSAPVTATGGLMFALGALGFVYNMWRTFNAADARARARAMERVLPTLEQES